MGIDIKTSIRTTPSFNLLWCSKFQSIVVCQFGHKPSHKAQHWYQFRGIPPRASQANYTTPSNGWNSHNWLIKSKAAHHITSDLTTWVLILNTTGMMISSLVMTLVFQFLIRFLLLSPHQQLVSPYVTYFVFHPYKKKKKKILHLYLNFLRQIMPLLNSFFFVSLWRTWTRCKTHSRLEQGQHLWMTWAFPFLGFQSASLCKHKVVPSRLAQLT